MNVQRNKVYFYESFGLLDCVISYLNKRKVFYNSQSLLLRFALKLFGLVLYEEARTIWNGDLLKNTGIRRSAYERALKKVSEIQSKSWKINFEKTIQVDEELITHKFLFDYLFKKYEFYGIAKQYVFEQEGCSATLVVDLLLFEEDLISSSKIDIVKTNNFHRTEFVFSIISMSFFLFLFYKKYKKSDTKNFENAIVCEVDRPETYDMYRDLFGVSHNVFYITQKCYLDNFGTEKIQKLGILTHGLSEEDYRKLRAISRRFLYVGIRNIASLSNYGALFFGLYKTIADGFLLTIKARGSAFLVFEHMYTLKAVRNELLRANNNKSIFMPYNVYAVDHYYTPEHQYNYDILCSPGLLLERIYAFQKAKTQIMLPTGSYSPHKKSKPNDEYYRRVEKLKEFKGNSTVITFLCSGIQDESYSGEVRLMELACKLSKEQGVKILIRRKPGPTPEKYLNFYDDFLQDEESILLTYTEYELFDFLEVTDLFVTFWSSSAVDLCVAGAQFFSVNFWDDDDMYLWQTEVKGVYLEERTAYDSIMRWVHDSPSGEREAHKNRMSELSDIVAYKFENYEAYKVNFLKQLAPYLPNDSKKQGLVTS